MSHTNTLESRAIFGVDTGSLMVTGKATEGLVLTEGCINATVNTKGGPRTFDGEYIRLLLCSPNQGPIQGEHRLHFG